MRQHHPIRTHAYIGIYRIKNNTATHGENPNFQNWIPPSEPNHREWFLTHKILEDRNDVVFVVVVVVKLTRVFVVGKLFVLLELRFDCSFTHSVSVYNGANINMPGARQESSNDIGKMERIKR